MRLRIFSVDMTFQKARCVLHRKFFVTSKATGTYPYPYSVKACVEASMRILQSQISFHAETQPGRTLHTYRWRTSSLLTHDFLLAAMHLCLYIGNDLSFSASQRSSQGSLRIKHSRNEMLRTLSASYEIWEQSSSSSREAAKAAKALKSMLAKVNSVSRASDLGPKSHDGALEAQVRDNITSNSRKSIFRSCGMVNG